MFAFKAGHPGMGMDALAIVPANAGFFALGLAMLQGIIPYDELPDDFTPKPSSTPSRPSAIPTSTVSRWWCIIASLTCTRCFRIISTPDPVPKKASTGCCSI
jgi:hypothetical protein